MTKFLFWLLAVTTLCAVVFAARLSWQIYGPGGWRDEVYGQVGINATRQAMEDFGQGQLRLYVLGGENEKRHFTGEMDDIFEVWVPQFYPSLGPAHQHATEQFIDFYNRKMRYMHSHPDKFLRSEAEVQPGSRAEPPPSV